MLEGYWFISSLIRLHVLSNRKINERAIFTSTSLYISSARTIGNIQSDKTMTPWHYNNRGC